MKSSKSKVDDKSQSKLQATLRSHSKDKKQAKEKEEEERNLAKNRSIDSKKSALKSKSKITAGESKLGEKSGKKVKITTEIKSKK